MSYKIREVEGIGPTYAAKLESAGIKTTDDLLSCCCDPKGRKSTAEQTGLGESVLLKWANMADLMRVHGIGGEYSELLEAAGVDTVKELRNRNSENLAAALKAANEERKLTRSVPSAAVVAKWIDAAKALEPKISH